MWDNFYEGGTLEPLSLLQYSLVLNVLNISVAAMGASCAFFLLQSASVDIRFRTTVQLSGIVTFIACYHYWVLLESFNEAYHTSVDETGVISVLGPTSTVNTSFRYLEWLLTVPLLLMGLVLVLGASLTREETYTRCVQLGGLATLMILFGFPGEITSSPTMRWVFWSLAMIPFFVIIFILYVGLSEAIGSQPRTTQGLVKLARFITVTSWSLFPFIYLFPMFGFNGSCAFTAKQIGYSCADIIAKPGFGILIWIIARRKSHHDLEESPLVHRVADSNSQINSAFYLSTAS